MTPRKNRDPKPNPSNPAPKGTKRGARPSDPTPPTKASRPGKRPTTDPVPRERDSVIKLMRSIKAGELKGRMLAPADRQRCVEHLTWEGWGVPEMAETLGVSERTVHRDRAQVRADNALVRSATLPGELAGVIHQQADRAVASLRRISKDAATPPSVRVETERIAFEIRRQLIQTLQSLGYLPTAASEFRGELVTEMGLQLPRFADLAGEAHQLATVARKRGINDPQLIAELKQLSDAATGFSIQQRTEELKDRIDQPGGD